MRVLIENLDGTLTAIDLGVLIQFSISPSNKDKYITHVYMNDEGKIVKDLYKASFSDTEPIISSIYKVAE